jgi:PST family polysaccharide transporter
MIVTGVLLALLSLALAPLVGVYFRSREIALVTAALSGLLIINGLYAVPFTLLRRRLVVRPAILIEPLAVSAFGATAAIGLVSGLGVWALVLGWYASSLTSAFGFWIAARWKPNLSLVSWELWRELAGYARHILLSEVLRETMNIANTALVGRFLGRTNLGQFRFAWRLATQVSTPILAANAYTIQPALVRLADDQLRIRAVVMSALRMLGILTFPIGSFFIPLGEQITLVLFGEKWRHMGSILAALSGMAIALPMISLPLEVFKARGRPDIVPRIYALWALGSIGLMVALVPLGTLGIALAASVSAIVVAIYALVKIRVVVNIQGREIAEAILPALTSAALMCAFLLAFNRFIFHSRPEANFATLVRLVLELGLGIAVYLAFLAIFAKSALKEIAQTISLMPGLRKSR